VLTLAKFCKLPADRIRGPVLVQAPPFAEYRYGDRIRAEGKLQTPPDTNDFDYREYLVRQDVYSLMSRPRITVRSVGIQRQRFVQIEQNVRVQVADQLAKGARAAFDAA
jgi:Domain of unknown function (DUF4131)